MKDEALIIGLALDHIKPEKKDKVFVLNCSDCNCLIFITPIQQEKLKKEEYNYLFNCIKCFDKKIKEKKEEYQVIDLNPNPMGKGLSDLLEFK